MVKNKYRPAKPKVEGKAAVPVVSAKEFEGLNGFEELSSYVLLKPGQHGNVKREVWKDGKIVKKKNKKKKKKPNKEESETEKKNGEGVSKESNEIPVESSVKKKKKKRKKKKQISNIEGGDNLNEPGAGKYVLKRNFEPEKEEEVKQVVKKARYDKVKHPGFGQGHRIDADFTIWKNMFVPEPVVEALAELGFEQPTEIQRLTLPAAIKGRKDVIGAAETGSGKTLAFGIPIIHGILRDKEYEAEHGDEDSDEDSGVDDGEGEGDEETEGDLEGVEDTQEDIAGHEDGDNECDSSFEVSKEEDEEENDAEGSGDETVDENLIQDDGIGCVKVIDNVKFDFLDNDDNVNVAYDSSKKLRALVITPTRELAIQVKSHLDAVLVHTDINTTVVVGGMAPQKQERLLLKGPDIVIGTPGRLWELIQQGNPHLAQVTSIRYLAIDETDRMVERGHFRELQDLLELINSSEKAKTKRQTFVFSATLTTVHEAPKRASVKKKSVKVTSQMKIEKLMKMIGLKPKPKIVDITQKFGTAASLTEAKIVCDKFEKDFYLYYFLKRYPGRTLVFCNSVDCVRRLQSLFTFLQCGPQSLHASMHQKQRLKSLERFSSNPRGFLLATDVAARGLDIPNIQHVIHYQVPRTVETYIHRSGRTARATQEGLSVLLVDGKEATCYHRICTTLKREADLPPFPVDIEILRQVKERVNLARGVEKLEYSQRKSSVEDNWLKKAAQEAELLLDEDDLDEDEKRAVTQNAAQMKREIQKKRAQLNQMLSHPLVSSDFSGKYPTQTGILIDPHREMQAESNKALTVMKKETEEYTSLAKKVKIKPLGKKVNKKKYKGFEKRRLKRQKEKEKMMKEMEKEKQEF
ncbi:ATP-dependent RNA helicase DDX24 [Oratosquilla oratoria]|uniref:ATP-dependent RNA helicase DDX24 n=1 Tax=Oratosquilla oratoria TaxID=337810 RepID=UPI003F758FDB